MRHEGPKEPIETPQADATSPAPTIDRTFGRQLLREMTRMQIDDGPLRWSQRRELVRFARRMGIDTFEARLIIRAVEYECGVAAPAGLDDRESPADRQLVAPIDDSILGHAPLFLLPVAVLVIVMLAWIASASL